MFNSGILDTYGLAYQNIIWKRQKEIGEYFYDTYLESESSDTDPIDDYFFNFFPPGFLARDKEKAKKVLLDIWDITRSSTIRYEIKAIYCYVMYHMIEVWFDNMIYIGNELMTDELNNSITEIENFRRQRGEYEEGDDEEPSEKEAVRSWFTDKNECLHDFECIYDQDFISSDMPEVMAVAYLKDPNILDPFGVDIQEVLDLLPNDLYEAVTKKLEKEEREKRELAIAADNYVEQIWSKIEGNFDVLMHGDSPHVSSYQGAKDILNIFKDWVENNGGWKDVQDADPSIRETVIHRLMLLGAKNYLKSQNLDMNCENNIGVGQEDIKISRGNDKTIIEVKLTSNPRCSHGFEIQLPRYAEAEHTSNMIYCLIDLGDKKTVDDITALYEKKKRMKISCPEIYIIDAKPQKSASKL